MSLKDVDEALALARPGGIGRAVIGAIGGDKAPLQDGNIRTGYGKRVSAQGVASARGMESGIFSSSLSFR